MCLGLEPGAAGWKAQTNPLSYGDTPMIKTVKRRETDATKLKKVKECESWFKIIVGFEILIILS